MIPNSLKRRFNNGQKGFIEYGVVVESIFSAGGKHWEALKKDYETDEEKAKHAAAKRWVSAANNWRNLGEWCFHVCRDPQLLGKE